MKRNEAPLDRVLRFVAAIAAAAVAASLGVTTAWGVVLLVVAVVLAVTAITGFCPLYRALGLSTHRQATTTGAGSVRAS
jgi:hypothetical protein